MLIFNADRVREPLHVIVPLYNPWRYKSRIKHLQRTLKHLHDSGATITLIEIGFNRRELMFADSGLDGTPTNCDLIGSKYKHKYIGLHTKEEIWQKERAINLAVQSLPYDWQQVAWVDGDVHFLRPNFVGECIHKLQHGTSSDIAFCQMFSQAFDLAPNYEILPADYPHAQGVSFVKAWQDGTIRPTLTTKILNDLKAIGGDLVNLLKDFMKLEQDIEGSYYGEDSTKRVWPGLAWSATRKAWDSMGGLLDIAIWGGSDYSCSKSLIGDERALMVQGLHPNYKKMTMEWHERAQKFVRRNVLVMEGAVTHYFHGRKIQRGYAAKHELMAKYSFDPLRHLKMDSQGLHQFNDDGSECFIQLRDQFRKIATARNEDSIDTGLENTKIGH